MAERLSGMDSSFVALESATMPQHVMGVLVLDASEIDGGLSFDLFRRILQDRIHLMKPLRRRLVEVPLGLDHPRFVEDPDFDLDAHLEEVTLPARVASGNWRRSSGRWPARSWTAATPLWQMWVVQGLADGRAAIVTKMHHATMDGVTGADLMAHLFDLSPEPRTIEEPAGEHVGEATPPPGAWPWTASSGRPPARRRCWRRRRGARSTWPRPRAPPWPAGARRPCR
jgi:diacylglycerol O-acyltransferase / wax synthase